MLSPTRSASCRHDCVCLIRNHDNLKCKPMLRSNRKNTFCDSEAGSVLNTTFFEWRGEKQAHGPCRRLRHALNRRNTWVRHAPIDLRYSTFAQRSVCDPRRTRHHVIIWSCKKHTLLVFGMCFGMCSLVQLNSLHNLYVVIESNGSINSSGVRRDGSLSLQHQ